MDATSRSTGDVAHALSPVLPPGFLTREYLAAAGGATSAGRLFLVLALAMFAVFRLVGNVPG
jgi:hypothetical protein